MVCIFRDGTTICDGKEHLFPGRPGEAGLPDDLGDRASLYGAWDFPGGAVFLVEREREESS